MGPREKCGASDKSARQVPLAFTLIELLVVLAIISLLMAVLLPSVQRARRRAKATVCLAQLKQWGTGFVVYAQDNEGYLPAEAPKGIWLLRGTSANQSGPNEPRARLSIDTEGIVCCPMATRPAHKPGTFAMSVDVNSVPVLGTVGRVFDAWEVTSPGTPFRGSYGLNQSLFEPQVPAKVEPAQEPEPPRTLIRRRYAWSPPVPRPQPPRPTIVESVKKPPVREMNVFTVKGTAGIPMLLDSTVPIHTPRGEGVPPPPDGGGAGAGGMGPYCTYRHDGYGNGLFLDWSVRRVGLKELWTLKWNSEWNTAGRWTRAGGVKPEEWPKWMRGFKDY
jgi:prepilin-type N-terminal cleavage/methylation domain-containing protein/prepilin-type processing-associated H-X9-DG protein